MFMVINKDKIVSYIISFSTVAILFGMSFVLTKQNDEILQTSTNYVQTENQDNKNRIANQAVDEDFSNKTIKNEYNRIGEK